MKKIIFLSAFCALCTQAQSQSWGITGNAGTDPATNFIGTTDNKPFKIRTNNKVRFIVNANGNVGVGNITPAVKLHIKADNEAMRIEGANPFLQFNNGSTAVGYHWANGNTFVMGTNSTNTSGNLQFWTGGNTRMAIGAGGNVTMYGNSLTLNQCDFYSDGNTLEINAFRPSIPISTPGNLILQRTTFGTFDYYAGNVGIGLNNPLSKLHVTADSWDTGIRISGSTGAGPGLYLDGPAQDWALIGSIGSQNGLGGNVLGFWDATSSFYRMTIAGNGNIGIGNNILAQYKLDVCGTIRATEVRVSSGWCDYVFDRNYALMPLNEVEKFIKENKHLPGIPPASEVEQEGGLKVSEMMSSMMKKIEELTLYTIELEKKVKKLESKKY